MNRRARAALVVLTAVALQTPLLGGLPAASAATAPPDGLSATETRIWKKLNERDSNPRLRWTYTGRVEDALGGYRIYSYGSMKPMKSASTMKAVTSAIALRLYGKDHLFPTKAFQGSTPREVVLRAGGDPLLTRTNLRTLAGRVATNIVATLPADYGSSTISYTVRADDTLFGDPTRPPGWIGTAYNRVRAFLLDRQRTDDSTRDAGISFAASLAAALDARLKDRGIDARVSYAGRGTTPEGATRLGTFLGHSVGDSIRTGLAWSDSNISEMLARHVAIAAGKPATREGAVTALREQLEDLGVFLEGVQLSDGSGLSHYTKLTALTLVEVMQAAMRPEETRMNALRSLMMVAGRTGTLSTYYGRFVTSNSRCAIGYAWGKSGTLTGVITLTGYAKAKDGRYKAFAFMVNNRSGSYSALQTRQAIDGLVATIVGCW